MGRVKDLLPDDWEGYDGPDEPECDHTDYEVNWDGYAHCLCGARWLLTAEQHEQHIRWEQQYQARMDHENKWWVRAWRWLQDYFTTRRAIPPDDEIPF
jgi:hypothetical protein